MARINAAQGVKVARGKQSKILHIALKNYIYCDLDAPKLQEGLLELLNTVWLQGGSWIGFLWLSSYWIRRATKDFDDDLSSDFRSRLADGLRRHTSKNSEWINSFQMIFTHVFGNKHLSWLCIRRSLLISTSTFLLIGLSIGTFPISRSDSEQLTDVPGLAQWASWLLIPACIGLFYNGLLDYFSLWKSRIIIQSALPIPIKILLELVLTTFLVYFGFLFLLFILTYFGLSMAVGVEDSKAGAGILLIFMLFSIQFMSFPPDFSTIAFVIFFTSFTVSIWVVLHAIGGLTFKIVPALFSALNVEEKPVRALGVVGAAAIWILGILTLIIFASTNA